jgi:hypothetical protein
MDPAINYDLCIHCCDGDVYTFKSILVRYTYFKSMINNNLVHKISLPCYKNIIKRIIEYMLGTLNLQYGTSYCMRIAIVAHKFMMYDLVNLIDEHICRGEWSSWMWKYIFDMNLKKCIESIREHNHHSELLMKNGKFDIDIRIFDHITDTEFLMEWLEYNSFDKFRECATKLLNNWKYEEEDYKCWFKILHLALSENVKRDDVIAIFELISEKLPD